MSIRQKLFGFGVLKSKYELLPLVSFVGAVCTMGVSFSFYSLYQKPDVRVVKSTESPPFERINPEQPQKLITFNMKYKKIPELEALREEIGSYKA